MSGAAGPAAADGTADCFKRTCRIPGVFIGFRRAPEPVPPTDVTVWIASKDTREARAVVRMLPIGRELRVYVRGELMSSRPFRENEISARRAAADGCLCEFSKARLDTPAAAVTSGWKRDTSA